MNYKEAKELYKRVKVSNQNNLITKKGEVKWKIFIIVKMVVGL